MVQSWCRVDPTYAVNEDSITTMVYARSNVPSHSEITAPRSVHTKIRYLLPHPINKRSL